MTAFKPGQQSTILIHLFKRYRLLGLALLFSTALHSALLFFSPTVPVEEISPVINAQLLSQQASAIAQQDQLPQQQQTPPQATQKQDVALNAVFDIDGQVSSTNEALNGIWTANVAGSLQDDSTDLETIWNLITADADTSFTGQVAAVGTSTSGNDLAVNFDGIINAKAAFFYDDSLGEEFASGVEANMQVTSFEIRETVSGVTQLTKLENATVTATAGLLTTTSDDIFLFDGEEQYEITEMSVVGTLTTENGLGGSATISVNAVVNLDFSGLPYVSFSLPEEGEQFATLNYNLTTTAADDGTTVYHFEPDHELLNETMTEIFSVVLNGGTLVEYNPYRYWYLEAYLVSCTEVTDSETQDCTLEIIEKTLNYYEVPLDSTAEEKAAYTLTNHSTADVEILSADFSTIPCESYEYGDTESDGTTTDTTVTTYYCPAFVELKSTVEQTGLNLTATEEEIVRSVLNDTYSSSYSWQDSYTNMGAGDGEFAFTVATDGISDFILSSASLYQAPVSLNWKDFYFDVEDYETENAYIQLSASLLVTGAVTGLIDASVNVYVQRTGSEDGKGQIKLSYGGRSIDLAVDSMVDISEVTNNHLIIRNQDTEMTIRVDCVVTDEDFSNVQENTCSGDLRFSGTIIVADQEIGVIEDRDGTPVFTFNNGAQRKLVVVPQFLIE
jgi:hypothetical protein